VKETVKLSLSLAIICALAASVLAYANWQTAGPRQDAELRQRQAALELVLPTFANNPIAEAITLDGVTFYPARDGNATLLAVAGEGVTGKGFGGELKALVGFAPDGSILTVMVTAHKETPGLGTQATDRKEKKMLWDLFRSSKKIPEAKLPPCKYLDRYTGMSAGVVGGNSFKLVTSKAEVSEDTVLAVSGATVSSRAVADAVANICHTLAATKFVEH